MVNLINLEKHIQLELLLKNIYCRYGFDLREYSQATIEHRIKHFMSYERISSLSMLQELILKSSAFFEKFLNFLLISTTEMFRDPGFYQTLRRIVIPILNTYPSTRIWVIGCATGEEAYSIAILLHEAGIYHRSIIYATDCNSASLENAKTGSFSLEKMEDYNINYLRAQGQKSLCEYFILDKKSGKAFINPFLKRNIIFFQHNLVTDDSFNEFNLIICRNVLIYFNETLKKRVYQLIYNSHRIFGILALGQKESLLFSPLERYYKVLDTQHKLYKKMI